MKHETCTQKSIWSNNSNLLDNYSLEEITEKRKWLTDNEDSKLNLRGATTYSSDNWQDNELYDIIMLLNDDNINQYKHNRKTDTWIYGKIETTILETTTENFKDFSKKNKEKYNFGVDEISIQTPEGDLIYVDVDYNEIDSKATSMYIKIDKWIIEKVITDEVYIENLFIASRNPTAHQNRTYLQMWDSYWSYHSQYTQDDIKRKKRYHIQNQQ